jgi:hypothetical protein
VRLGEDGQKQAGGLPPGDYRSQILAEFRSFSPAQVIVRQHYILMTSKSSRFSRAVAYIPILLGIARNFRPTFPNQTELDWAATPVLDGRATRWLNGIAGAPEDDCSLRRQAAW